VAERRPTAVSVAEHDLIARAQAGDRRALDQLLRSHYNQVYSICRRMTGNDQDALDATQDALIALTRGIHRYDGRASFSTWSYRVTTNACLDELRRRKRRPVPEADVPVGARPGGPPSLDQTVVDRLTLDQALTELAPEFRAPVILRDVIGLDYAEIAEVLKIPPGTVRSRIARGRRSLATQMARNQPPPPSVQHQAP
jgi:RNA polymerase sigma-70 factor (ECF subfamily)